MNSPPPGFEAWPTFHHDASHLGVSAETTIGKSTVAQLVPAWQVNTGSSTYTSPAVDFVGSLGKVVVWQGSKSFTENAYDASTGTRIWSFRTSGSITSSTSKFQNSVYFGSADHNLYALNATTGSLRCRFDTGGVVASSPVVADPDGTGPVAYFGDNGLSGADDGGAEWAVNATDCTLKWKFNAWNPRTGSWSPPAFATDKDGRKIIVFGASDPDNAVYALDAVTGALVWRAPTEVIFPDNDVGAGPTISAPGVNGFADGVVYINGKDQISYAFDLTTGSKIWEFRVRDDSPNASGTTRSTSALAGNKIFFGYGAGVYSLSAIDGHKIWKTTNSYNLETVSSPAIGGAPGDQVLFVGDLSGLILALDPANGNTLWSYKTGGFIYGSAAIGGGKMFIGSSDGFLYAFERGRGASGQPDTAITSPDDGSTIPPSSQQQIAGTASDDVGVVNVLVAIRDSSHNKWWDGTTQTWVKVFTQNDATLANPAMPSTTWTYEFPAPAAGGQFFSQAEAVDRDGQHDPTVAISKFAVLSSGHPPDTAISSPVPKQVFNLPAEGQIVTINVTGTATDTTGPDPGVAQVKVVIENLEHQEYFCGSVGCGGPSPGESANYTPTFTTVLATMDHPGATSVNWTIQFPTFDHPHNYKVVAFAVDNDGESDTTKAVASPICVRDPGVKTCA